MIILQTGLTNQDLDKALILKHATPNNHISTNGIHCWRYFSLFYLSWCWLIYSFTDFPEYMDEESLVHAGVEISDHMWSNYTLPSGQLVFENTFNVEAGSTALLPLPFPPRTPIVPPHYSANPLSQTPKGDTKPPLRPPHPKILSKQEMELYYGHNSQVESFYTYLTGNQPVQSHGVAPPDPEWLTFTTRL